MITVLHGVTTWLPQTQTWLYNQLKYLPQNIESHVVCENTENLDQFNIPNIHCLLSNSRLNYYCQKFIRKIGFLNHLPYVGKIIKSTNSTILHSHFGHCAWGNMQVADSTKTPHIVTYYGMDVNHYPQIDKRWIYRYIELFKKINVVLCEGPYMAKSIEKLGCPPNKIKVHHLGVEIDSIQFQPREYSTKISLKVLMVGSFKEKKGFPDALRALGKLNNDIELQITIIGDADYKEKNQREKKLMIDVAKKNGIYSKINWLGYQSHSTLMELAYKNHIFLSPSKIAEDGDSEGGAPVSIIEMVATGMPIVSTIHCDIPNVIINNETGLLSEEGDVNQIYNNLLWLIRNPSKWGTILSAGRKHVEQNFNVVKQGELLANIYESLMN